jgi:hypothetical protein
MFVVIEHFHFRVDLVNVFEVNLNNISTMKFWFELLLFVSKDILLLKKSFSFSAMKWSSLLKRVSTLKPKKFHVR